MDDSQFGARYLMALNWITSARKRHNYICSGMPATSAARCITSACAASLNLQLECACILYFPLVGWPLVVSTLSVLIFYSIKTVPLVYLYYCQFISTTTLKEVHRFYGSIKINRLVTFLCQLFFSSSSSIFSGLQLYKYLLNISYKKP